jgi:hypothetical protein
MKNVKTLLIFMITSTLLLASATRTDALGGAGFWADDYANIGAFPASVNNHNVAWTNGDDFTSVWNVDGTTWGFAGGSGDDMANVWWGNGSIGMNFGLGMTPENDATAVEEANTALNVGFGMPLAGMDFGFTYGMGCNDCGGGNVGINLRRPQSIWLFENILVDFDMGMDDVDTKAIAAVDAVVCGDDAAADCVAADAVVANPMNESSMGLGAHFYTNTAYDSGINSLFGLGFNYGSVGDADPTMGIEWNFAVESAMTDWATLRIGYSHNYDFATGDGDSDDSMNCGDGTEACGDAVGGLVVGLGFNYGSFNLDMNVGGYEDLFTNPGQYITGRNSELGANWTISYNW